jgi:hypothetical protein
MTGINTVARSLPLEAGDKIIYVSITVGTGNGVLLIYVQV